MQISMHIIPKKQELISWVKAFYKEAGGWLSRIQASTAYITCMHACMFATAGEKGPQRQQAVDRNIRHAEANCS